MNSTRLHPHSSTLKKKKTCANDASRHLTVEQREFDLGLWISQESFDKIDPKTTKNVVIKKSCDRGLIIWNIYK